MIADIMCKVNLILVTFYSECTHYPEKKSIIYQEKRMKKYTHFFFTLLCAFTPLLLANPALEEIDPERILSNMVNAMKNSQTIRYSATHEYLGARSAVWAAIEGNVFFKKLPEENSFKTKIALFIKTYGRGSDENIQMLTTFNGQSVTKKEDASKIITETVIPENSATLATMSLLIGGNNGRLILWDFFLPSPSKPTLIQYDGQVAVKGVLCHVVYTEREYDYFDRKRKSMKRWFIGTKDNLPRRIESYSVTEEGRVYADALTLTGLEIDRDIPDSTFEIKDAPGYKKNTITYSPPQQKQKTLLNISDKAPDWTLLDPEGRKVSLSQYKDKIVVMDFWAVWCGPCKVLMPALQKIHDRFKDRGVFVIGIDSPMGVEGETARAPQYMKNMGYTYTLLLEGDATAKIYQVPSLPTLYIIGADGNILYVGVGVESEGEEKKPSETMQAYYEKLVKIIEKQLQQIRH